MSPRVAFKAYEKAVYDRNWIVAIDPINSAAGPGFSYPYGLGTSVIHNSFWPCMKRT